MLFFSKIPTNDRGTDVEVTLLTEFEEVLIVAQAAGNQIRFKSRSLLHYCYSKKRFTIDRITYLNQIKKSEIICIINIYIYIILIKNKQ